MITLKLIKFPDDYEDDYNNIKFHIINPNLQIITPNEEDENPRLFTFNIYDYDYEKIICTYEIRFTLNRKKLTSSNIKGNFQFEGNELSIKQHSRYENNGINFNLNELKEFVLNLKKNIGSSFTLFIAESNLMLVVSFDPEENVLNFENMIMCKTKHFESCEIQIELSLLNPLVKNNIIDQFDNLHKRLTELEILMVKKKIDS